MAFQRVPKWETILMIIAAVAYVLGKNIMVTYDEQNSCDSAAKLLGSYIKQKPTRHNVH